MKTCLIESVERQFLRSAAISGIPTASLDKTAT